MRCLTKVFHKDGTPLSPEELQELNLKLQAEDDERWRRRQAEDPIANERFAWQLGL